MTEKQFVAKVKSMKREIGNYAEKEALRLFKSGGVDTGKFGNDFALPKICLSVAFEEAAWRHGPLYDDHKKIARNLKHF